MWTDPIVEEVREIRETHAARFKYDLRAIFHAVKEAEASSEYAYICLPAKQFSPVAETEPEIKAV